MVREIATNTDDCQSEEIQRRLTNWNPVLEMEMLDKIEAELATIPENVLGRPTTDFTEPMNRYITFMRQRYDLMQQLADMCGEAGFFQTGLDACSDTNSVCTIELLSEVTAYQDPARRDEAREGDEIVIFPSGTELPVISRYRVGSNNVSVCVDGKLYWIDTGGGNVKVADDSDCSDIPVSSVLINENTNLYTEPDFYSEVITNLSVGTAVTITSFDDEHWLQVSLEHEGEAIQGWIFKPRASSYTIRYIDCGDVPNHNIRATPAVRLLDGYGWDQVGVLVKGSEFFDLGIEFAGWRMIQADIFTGGGYQRVTGWIHDEGHFVDTQPNCLPTLADNPTVNPAIGVMSTEDDLEKIQQVLDCEAEFSIEQIIAIALVTQARMKLQRATAREVLFTFEQFSCADELDISQFGVGRDPSDYEAVMGTPYPDHERQRREEMLVAISTALIENRPLDEVFYEYNIYPNNPDFQYGTFTHAIFGVEPFTTPTIDDALELLPDTCPKNDPGYRDRIIGVTPASFRGNATVIFRERHDCSE